MQNYPNPFNPVTTIRYTVEDAGRVILAVYNTTGQRVKSLVDGLQESGDHSVSWDSHDDGGTAVASGVYFYRLTVRGQNGKQFAATKKMLIVK